MVASAPRRITPHIGRRPAFTALPQIPYVGFKDPISKGTGGKGKDGRGIDVKKRSKIFKNVKNVTEIN